MKVPMQHKMWLLVICLLLLNLVTACDKGQVIEGSTNSKGTVYKMSDFDTNQYPMNKTVCDPFSGGTPATPQNGVKASLYYRGKDQPRYYSVNDYISKYSKSSQNLFFQDLFVPTRMFSEGFKTQTSNYVQDDNGYRLVEYFALKFETQIQLSPNMTEGNYEFSSLADDGMVMKAKINGVWETIIENDGDHPTKMGCAKKFVHMKQGKPLQVELLYYQGPRYHISNVLLWKYVGSGNCSDSKPAQDLSCGKQGNEYFFDPNHGSVPLKPFQDLLARGWKVVGSENFYVGTSTANYNPCYQGTAPVISELVVQPGMDQAIFRWTTNIPSTSQILISDTVTGEQTLTVSDNALRTEHEIVVTGLAPNTSYRARAVSVSDDLGRAISNELSFVTFPLIY